MKRVAERAPPVGEPTDAEDRPTSTEPPVSYRSAKAEAIAAWESAFVADLFHRYDGNLSAAARAVRMDRNHLRSLLHRYGIRCLDA